MLLSRLVLVKHVLNTCIGISKTFINWGFNLLLKNFNHLLQFPLNKITDRGQKNCTTPLYWFVFLVLSLLMRYFGGDMWCTPSVLIADPF